MSIGFLLFLLLTTAVICLLTLILSVPSRGVFDGASGAAAAALFVGAQTPSGHKLERERKGGLK